MLLWLRASRTHVDIFEEALNARVADFPRQNDPDGFTLFGEQSLPLDLSKKDSR